MVGEFLAGGGAFVDGFFGVSGGRVEFEVEPFFHGADDQEADAAGENDAVGGDADKDFGPVGDFGEDFIKRQDEFGRPAFKEAVEVYAPAIMAVILPG